MADKKIFLNYFLDNNQYIVVPGDLPHASTSIALPSFSIEVGMSSSSMLGGRAISVVINYNGDCILPKV